MGFFTTNRQVEGKFGTGLPIYDKKEYQERFRDIPAGSNLGLWQVPNNQLPTTQFKTDVLITEFKIIEATTTTDGAEIIIDVTQVEKVCLADGSFVWSIKDDPKDFTLDCGVYYYFFELDNGNRPPLYSERFLVGGVCNNQGSLTLDTIGIPSPDIIVDIGLHSLLPVVAPDTLTATVDATNYTADFQVTISPDTSKLIDVILDTARCGTYTNQYRLQYTTGPISVTLTKLYP